MEKCPNCGSENVKIQLDETELTRFKYLFYLKRLVVFLHSAAKRGKSCPYRKDF